MKGFSLVELSIVLVILGLLTGGILAGQSLIRAAELRALGNEYSRYTTAVNSFRDKYFSVPGDFSQATRFWGWGNTTNCLNLTGAAANAAGTCDGDGNNEVFPDYDRPAGTSQESFEFWRHLAKAGLIEGNYTGISGSANNINAILGTNSPSSRIAKVGWGVIYEAMGGAVNAANYHPIPYVPLGNHFRVGIPNGNLPAGDFMLPVETWNLDTKMDDGKPASGRMVVRRLFSNSGTPPHCTNAVFNANAPSSVIGQGNRDYDSDYELSTTAPVCSFLLRF